MIKKIFNFFKLNPIYEKRVFGLDLMRALAILFVVIGHGKLLLKGYSGFPWVGLIDGVELFFVLSGFLIGGIIIKLFQNNKSFNIKIILNFWKRRWFRTLPNYYLILLINIIFVYFGFIKEDFSQFNWKFFVFLQNFAHPFHGFFWESWSLSIEEWFYLLFPIVLSAIYFLFKSLKVSKKNIFLYSVLTFLIATFLLRFFIASKFNVDQFFLGIKIFKVVIFRLDGIALGLLAAFYKYWYPNLWFKSRNVSFVIGIVLSYIIIYSTWLPNDFSTKVFKILFQSIACFLLLPKFDSIKTAPKFITKVFTHISLISYSMYLINLALVAEVILHNFPPYNAISSYVLYFFFWFVVIIGSTLLYKYFEKPITELRDKKKNNDIKN